MGTYDAKFHAYEQAIKKDPAWAKMTKQQRAEQLGRYSVGLQRDAEKAAKKAAGKAFAKELAQERAAKQKVTEELGKMLTSKSKYNLVTDPVNITADKIDDMLGVNKGNAVLDGMGDYYRFLEERSDYKRAIGKVLKKRPKVTADKIDDMLGINKPNPILDGMGDYYRALEQQGQKGGNKFLDFLKNNKKALLIGAGVLAAVGVGTWLWNKFSDKKTESGNTEAQVADVAKNEPTDTTAVKPGVVQDVPTDSTTVVPGVTPVAPADSTVVPTDSTTVVPGVTPVAPADSTVVSTDSTTVVPGVTPVAPADSTVVPTDSTKVVPGVTPVAPADATDTTGVVDEANATNESDKTRKDETVKINTPNGKYIVKKGDNVWNIAKKQLEDELGRRPFNREICERRDEIMALNPNLKYEADNYTVLIYPKQELNIAS